MDAAVAAPLAPAVARDERSLFAMYVGKNAKRFLALYDSMYPSATPVPSEESWLVRRWYATGFNWSAALFGPVWFFYRKLYIEACAMILIPIGIAILFPDLKASFGFGAVIGYLANRYYVWRAVKRIRAIAQMPTTVEGRDALIRSRGGVSIAGLIVGIVVLAGLVALVVAAKRLEKQQAAAVAAPACDSVEMHDLVLQRITAALQAKNISAAGVSVSDFGALKAEAPVRRCRFTLRAPGEEAPFVAEVTRTDGQLQFKMQRFDPQTPD